MVRSTQTLCGEKHDMHVHLAAQLARATSYAYLAAFANCAAKRKCTLLSTEVFAWTIVAFDTMNSGTFPRNNADTIV